MVYNINGDAVGDITPEDYGSLDYDMLILNVNHRGFNGVAPENTLPAYILSKKMGFNYVETDVSFTSDGVAVLLHDATIDRTSNGTGAITSMTYQQVLQYDFGSWKSQEYAGTKIPTLAEFLDLCRSIMLYPYIELKRTGNYTQARIESIVDMVQAYGMKGKVTYISFDATYLGYVKNHDPDARLGFLKNSYEASDVATCLNLRTGTNQVFYDTGYYNDKITQSMCDAFMAENIPVEAWTVDSTDVILGLNKYVSGVTSDNLIAGKVLYDNVMK